MHDDFQHTKEVNAERDSAAAAIGAAALADALASAPCSNYGAKENKQNQPNDDDFSTGERVEIKPRRGGFKAIRQIDPVTTAPVHGAIIDGLSFSVRPTLEVDQPSTWVLEELSRYLPIKECQYKPRKGGFAGYRFCADIEGVGLIAWGGESQRGRVTFSMMGGGCSTVHDWQGMQDWLEQHSAKITRADVAHDDFEGLNISIPWAIEQYKSGGFNSGGRAPKHQCFGSWLDQGKEREPKGLTLGVGSRTSGKYCRIYEKGKQLGDSSSPWTRVEVEWHSRDRHIPYDILTKPGQYLAGAYPCLTGLSETQAVIKTIAKASKAVYEKAVGTARQQTGKLINLILQVEEGDCGAVVDRLRCEGIPKRIEPWSYHIDRDPLILDGPKP